MFKKVGTVMRNEKWVLLNKKADFYQLAEEFHIDPVIAKVMRNRDITSITEFRRFFSEDPDDFYEPMMMDGMFEAVLLLQEKIEQNAKIRIISDYDVDGVMSNYILLKGLQKIGAIVDYEIPDRMKDGYGINERMIREAHEAGIDTIITCDNGISAIEQISYAKEIGMTVIVTDHHDIPFEYQEDGSKLYLSSNADVIINPKQELCNYPFKDLCGAGVAYKLVYALYEKMGLDLTLMQEYLEFVAIATICDVMELKDENRLFVKLGLRELNRTGNRGLKALLMVNDMNGKRIESYHVGFVLGPCINATGRLGSAKLSLELLLEEDMDRAIAMAEQLKEINGKRKQMTDEGEAHAIELIENAEWKDQKVYVVYLPDCHESIAGIIAGRIKERYCRPVLIVTNAEEGILKGSARSIDDYNIYDALTECKDVLLRYGGHAMAAGFSLKKKDLNLLRHKLNLLCDLEEESFCNKIRIDAAMPIDYIRFDLIEQMDLLEPFGKGNERPLFAQKDLHVMSAKVLGKNQNLLKFELESKEGARMEGVFFQPEEFLEDISSWYGQEACDEMLQGWLNEVYIDVVYYPSINEFNGLRAMQIVLKSYNKSESCNL